MKGTQGLPAPGYCWEGRQGLLGSALCYTRQAFEAWCSSGTKGGTRTGLTKGHAPPHLAPGAAQDCVRQAARAPTVGFSMPGSTRLVAADVRRHLRAPLWVTWEGKTKVFKTSKPKSGASAATGRLDAGGCGQIRAQIPSDSFPWTKSGQAAEVFCFSHRSTTIKTKPPMITVLKSRLLELKMISFERNGEIPKAPIR